MFGMLTVGDGRALSALCRGKARLRAASGLEEGRGIYRMSMFAWVGVTLLPGWKDGLKEKRVAQALCRLKAQGVRRVTLPPAWHDLARRLDLQPLDTRAAGLCCASAAVEEGCRALGLPLRGIGLLILGSRIRGPVLDELLALSRSAAAVCVRGADNEELFCKLCRVGVPLREDLPGDLPVLALLLEGPAPDEGCALTVDLRPAGEADLPGLWRPVLLPPPGAMALLPPGVPPEDFAAALLAAKALRPREIHVSRLDIAQLTQYNKEL